MVYFTDLSNNNCKLQVFDPDANLSELFLLFFQLFGVILFNLIIGPCGKICEASLQETSRDYMYEIFKRIVQLVFKDVWVLLVSAAWEV